MLSVLYSKRYDFEDPELLDYLEMIRNFTSGLDEDGAFTMIPEFVRRFMSHDASREMHKPGKKLYDFCEKQIKEHQVTIDPDNPRNFVDAYIIEKGVENTDIRMMCNTVMMLNPDGSDTMGIQLQWVLFSVTYYPEVQAKAQREIDSVVGDSRKPCLADRQDMPYIEAVINEIIRMYPAFAVSFSHATHKDVKFRG